MSIDGTTQPADGTEEWSDPREDCRPWLASSFPRRVHFFVALNEPVEVASDYTFGRCSSIPLGMARQLPEGIERPDDPDAPVFGFIEIRIHQSIARKISTEPIIAIKQTVDGLAQKFGFQSLPSAELSPPNDEIGMTGHNWSVAELIIEDYGISQGVFELFQSDMYPDFLTQSLWALEELMKAYRILARVPLADFTYRSLIPITVAVETDLDGRLLTPPTVWTLESVGGFWVESTLENRELAPPERHAILRNTAARISVGDPFMRYSDRLWRAERHADIEGQYDLAVLQAAIAIEGLLVSTWLATQWEKGESPSLAMEKVKGLAGKKPTKSILGWLSSELDGNWDPVNCEQARRWQDELMVWRNEIAHAGRSSGRGEARQAIEICRNLAAYVSSRLVVNFHKFPRTTLLSVGHYSLRRTLGSRVDRFLQQADEEEQFFIQLTNWLKAGLADEPRVSGE